MLDKSKLLREINKLTDTIFVDYSDELLIAQKIWREISEDSEFLKKINDIEFPLILPSWSENLSNQYLVNEFCEYSVFSCDGSQIYPDRHQGTSCFLINIGTVNIDYSQKNVKFDSVPFLFTQEDEDSVEIVDCKRQEYEFRFGLDLMLNHRKTNSKAPFIFLVDGSLIFWHLESKSTLLGQEYLGIYLGLLHQFYQHKLLIAGYISFPKSKELVNLIRAQIHLNNAKNNMDHLLDLHLAQFFLKKFHRTIIFKNNSAISDFYPEHLRPYFFYMNVGSEIARIEIPFWIANNPEYVDLVSRMILDQCVKGYGFPVCLAEAHEQAVIKSIDREYFYTLLNQLNVKNKQKVLMSQKSIKKKFMGF